MNTPTRKSAPPHASPVYTTEGIRRIEALAAASHDAPALMERAGLAAAELARELAGDSGRPIVIFAGPGNNGGDAFVAARHLKSGWYDVTVTFGGDAQKLPVDARAAFDAWGAAGGETRSDLPRSGTPSLIIDGLFGIGLERELSGLYAAWVRWINAAHAKVLALDVPSGIASDSGAALGCAVDATHTITFIALKPGLLTLDGPDHSGRVHVASLGLDTSRIVPAVGSVIGRGAVSAALAPRKLSSHKGTYGSVGIIGGSSGMVGAALLAGRAALRLGAGRVYVGVVDAAAPVVDLPQPELMLRPAVSIFDSDHVTCLAVGPGLGTSSAAASLLDRAIASPLPLVLDADALNLLASDENARRALKRRAAPSVLTPHPAEAARLLATSTHAVQRDRLNAVLQLAADYGCEVVLKGVGSICASADGTWAINTSGNPGMASAGMGDVLTGIVAALIAQGAQPRAALAAAVYLHGAAADTLIAASTGPVGLTASETIDTARTLLNAGSA